VGSGIPTAVLASGNGTNLESVIADARAGIVPLELLVVVSNNPEAFALERARRAGIDVEIVPFRRGIQSRGEYARELAGALQSRGVELVLLLGWMHVLAPEFLDSGFTGVLNLHPSFLPDDPAQDTVRLPDGTTIAAFRGAHALRDALNAGVQTTGASLIQITADVDRGPVLARKTCPLKRDDDENSALERLHEIEREVVREGILAWVASREQRART
jgi:phosphoribosylglycinamide formyltransferase-1